MADPLIVDGGWRIVDGGHTNCGWRIADGGLKAVKRGQPLVAKPVAPESAVLFEDETDIHLNPDIGRGWMLQGHQLAVDTPRQREARCKLPSTTVSIPGGRL